MSFPNAGPPVVGQDGCQASESSVLGVVSVEPGEELAEVLAGGPQRRAPASWFSMKPLAKVPSSMSARTAFTFSLA